MCIGVRGDGGGNGKVGAHGIGMVECVAKKVEVCGGIWGVEKVVYPVMVE